MNEPYMKRDLLQGDKVIIEDKEYVYESRYQRFEHISSKGTLIACPHCGSTSFKVRMQDYDALADCQCGHSMIVY